MNKSKISSETRDLISNAGKIAAQLGSLEVSTIHFFLADCVSQREDSILKFRFINSSELALFKKIHEVEGKEYVLKTPYGLPISSEARQCFIQAFKEMKRKRHKQLQPCHLFISALKIKETHLYKLFRDDKNALPNLINFYKTLQKDERLRIETEKISVLIFANTRLLLKKGMKGCKLMLNWIKKVWNSKRQAQSQVEYSVQLKAVLEKELSRLLIQKNLAITRHRFEEAANCRKVEKAMLALLQTL